MSSLLGGPCEHGQTRYRGVRELSGPFVGSHSRCRFGVASSSLLMGSRQAYCGTAPPGSGGTPRVVGHGIPTIGTPAPPALAGLLETLGVRAISFEVTLAAFSAQADHLLDGRDPREGPWEEICAGCAHLLP